jgi:hypothetical protein
MCGFLRFPGRRSLVAGRDVGLPGTCVSGSPDCVHSLLRLTRACSGRRETGALPSNEIKVTCLWIEAHGGATTYRVCRASDVSADHISA